MTILVVGASGATGRLVVEQVLNRGGWVKAVVQWKGQMPVIYNELEIGNDER